MKPYPNLKKHLDRFQEVITSNNKPYGLHCARREHYFTGEKIISLRKCAIPTFTYTDFDCYVSQTYFVIKTERVDQKYLTALLNSKLIAFWLRHRGKMQGFQHQIDKAPLVEIPLFKTSNQSVFALLVDYIILKKQYQLDSIFWERIIDALVYELYFSEKLKANGVEISKHLGNLPEIKQEQEQENPKIIATIQKQLSVPEHPINMNLQKLYDIEEIKIIEGKK